MAIIIILYAWNLETGLFWASWKTSGKQTAFQIKQDKDIHLLCVHMLVIYKYKTALCSQQRPVHLKLIAGCDLSTSHYGLMSKSQVKCLVSDILHNRPIKCNVIVFLWWANQCVKNFLGICLAQHTLIFLILFLSQSLSMCIFFFFVFSLAHTFVDSLGVTHKHSREYGTW